MRGRRLGPTPTASPPAARWAVHAKTVYGMIQRGELASRRVGRTIRIPIAVVESFEGRVVSEE